MVSVAFHNLMGYDAHIIIKDLATECQGRIDLLAKTKEKYISFIKAFEKFDKDCIKDKKKRSKIIKFKFIDSYKFMTSPLEKIIFLFKRI